MSVKIMSMVWELDLPQTRKLVLLAFADHANDEGVCYLSVDRIALKTGITSRQVQRIIKSLRAAGLLLLLRHEQGGRGKPAVYQVQPEKGEKLAPLRGEKGDTDVTLLAPERVTSATKGDTDVTLLGSSATKRVTSATQKSESKPNRPAVLLPPPSSPQAAATLIELPLNDGRQYAVVADAVAEWKQLYPAVNVMQELRNMRGWLLANREKRKTRRGIERFINAWLAKQQDKARPEVNSGQRKADYRRPGGAYHSGDPARSYDREPDLIVKMP